MKESILKLLLKCLPSKKKKQGKGVYKEGKIECKQVIQSS